MADSKAAIVTYEEWEGQVPREIRDDPLWEMKAYRLALFLHYLAWEDCARLVKDRHWKAMAAIVAMAGQLIRSAGSVSANIEEGYGRGFGRQFALFFRYALGSARETRGLSQSSRAEKRRIAIHREPGVEEMELSGAASVARSWPAARDRMMGLGANDPNQDPIRAVIRTGWLERKL